MLCQPQAQVTAKPGGQYREVISNGCWTWYGDPKAVYYKGTYERTYMSWITNTGQLQVASYDHNTGSQVTRTLRSGFERDDHDHPSLLVLPDGRITAFFSEHNGIYVYQYTTTLPENVSSWVEYPALLTVTTYPNVMMLSEENNRIYLFVRGDMRQPHYMTSEDSGRTWSRVTRIFQGDVWPYLKYASNNRNRIHIAAEWDNRDTPENHYHLYYEAGKFYKMDGTHIGSVDSLPVDMSKGDLIRSNSDGKRATVWDIALDPDGFPVIVWVKFQTNTDHRYMYTRWTGNAWLENEIVAANGYMGNTTTDFSPGITLDHGNPDVVYLSRQISGELELEQWETSNRGVSWSHYQITSNSSEMNTRPCVPRGSPPNSPAGLIWLYGRYDEYGEGKYYTGVRMCNPDTSPTIVALRDAPTTFRPTGATTSGGHSFVRFVYGLSMGRRRGLISGPRNRQVIVDVLGRSANPGHRNTIVLFRKTPQ